MVYFSCENIALNGELPEEDDLEKYLIEEDGGRGGEEKEEELVEDFCSCV